MLRNLTMLTSLFATTASEAEASNQGGSGNALVVLLVAGGTAWLCYEVFKPKKAKYRVEQATRIRKVK